MRSKRTLLAAGLVFAALAAGLVPLGPKVALIAPHAARAQNLGQRVVSGTVLDAGSAPVLGATVFLKNLKTKAIRSYTTTADGHFRFAQVSMVEDHDLWAEKGERKSPVKTVSSWDTRKVFEVEMKLK